MHLDSSYMAQPYGDANVLYTEEKHRWMQMTVCDMFSEMKAGMQ